MSLPIIKVGSRFGRLIVIAAIPREDNKGKRWKCLCSCGSVHTSLACNLLSGDITSCGCRRREIIAERNKILKATLGGISKDPDGNPLWASWRRMKARCENSALPGYKNYGGRGIKICGYLYRHPKNLMAVLGKRPGPGLSWSLDRIDNDGHYSCGKCKECQKKGWRLNIRWATRKQQMNNRRNCVLVTAFGETRTVAEWSDKTGLSWSLIRDRIKAGWSTEKAVSLPARVMRRRVE